MTTVLSPAIEDELRQRIEQTVRERWIAPLTPQPRKVAPTEADALAEAVLDAMLTRPFRISKLPEPAERQQLFDKVRHWVARGKPVHIRLGYAPMKNLHTVAVSRADWSEFFALTHLCAWHNKVCSVYPPGLRIKIVFDDSTVAMANRPDRRHMDGYIASVGQLAKTLGYSSFLVGTMRQSSFAWLFKFGLYQLAERRVRRFEADPANQPVIDQMLTFARRNLLLPPQLDEAAREQAWSDAAHRYRVYWEALQMSGLSRLGHTLVAMYLDGQQHHIRQEAALHVATLGKEQVTQPWQGPGALQDNGKGKLVPIVLTAGRRARFRVQEVGGLNLVPQDGFSSIPICWDDTPAEPLPNKPR